jgi:hypothetical protein
VAACGSRSDLRADGDAGPDEASSATTGDTAGASAATGSGGVPGGGGASGGGAGAGGAGGGAQEICAGLEIAGPPALLEGGFGHHERHPRWTLSSDDGAQVTLVTSRQAAEGPGGGDFPISVVHTTLKPWASFPSGGLLGPADLAGEEGGATFAAARSEGDRFALLFAAAPPAEGGLLFSRDFTPFESAPPPSQLVDSTAEAAMFAVQGPGGHLLGMHRSGASGGGQAYLFDVMLASDGGALAGPVSLGCASGPMYGDAVRVGEGWLVALSNAGPGGPGSCADPDLSWPDNVQIVATNGVEYEWTDYLGAPGGATDVKMAARSDGAWVILGTPPGQVVNGMFLGARVDLDGKVVSTFPVAGAEPGFEIPLNGTLTAAGVADLLAVAWIDLGGDRGPFLQVKVFHANGDPAGHVEIFPGTTFSGAPALLGSPTTASLVLAWSETPAQGAGDGDKIRAVRIDCLGSGGGAGS